MTTASVHDSREFEGLLDTTNASRDVFSDSAYCSAETEAKLKRQGYRSRIHRRGAVGAKACAQRQLDSLRDNTQRARAG